MKCISQYLRIMSLKMRWPGIWATFGIQTPAIDFLEPHFTIHVVCSTLLASDPGKLKGHKQAINQTE